MSAKPRAPKPDAMPPESEMGIPPGAVTLGEYERKLGRILERPDYVNMLLLQCLAVGLPTPEREFRFHIRRKWRLDLVWPPTLHLGNDLWAVEVDGGVYTQGRHTRGPGFVRDLEKLNEATLLGFRVLRVTPQQVMTGDALRLIERALKEVPTP